MARYVRGLRRDSRRAPRDRLGEPRLLAIDTATSGRGRRRRRRATARSRGRGRLGGRLPPRRGAPARGSAALLADSAASRSRTSPASSSGPGPGAFTGLRVGIATAKALAHALGAADRRRVRPARRCSPRRPARDRDRRPAAAGRAQRPDRRPAPGAAGAPAGGDEPELARRRARWSRSISTAGRPAAALARGERARTGFAAALAPARRGAARVRSTPTTSPASSRST